MFFVVTFTMDPVWIPEVTRKLRSIPNYSIENKYYAAYNKLLIEEFHDDLRYTVAPQMHPDPTSKEAIDFYIEFEIELEDKPVLLIEIKRGDKLSVPSARRYADEQIRKRMIDVADISPLNVLRGISIFGTNYCVYELNKEERTLIPVQIESSFTRLIDTAPMNRWSKDLLTRDGSIYLRQLFEQVKTECQDIS